MQEFRSAESIEWVKDNAYPEGVYEKILYRDSVTKAYVRLLRLNPGVTGSSQIEHEFNEVVYILAGGLVNLATGQVHTEGSYAVFPRGTKHGPFSAPVGCTTIEFRYY